MQDQDEQIKDPDGYATKKTTTAGLVDVSLFTSNISQLVTITRSEGGVNTAQEWTRVVFLIICMVLQVALMFILGYQRSQNINRLGEGANEITTTLGAANLRNYEKAIMAKKLKRDKKENKLNMSNYAATTLSTLMVLFNIIIAALVWETQT
ncbi:PREDICTED: uncharacterized protein LOC109476024 [Branchiostoma belcheri]|uniref:Uncharacterized protein LOC109476024 n=1 Tax=Branchiostoma belcheri TaxID=7741 RepID=A0A6P4YSH5_BRABE|nr:PREDICTED: uncharacterized protein LOC109476024 [Branchiostoma belcheri]